MDKKTSDNKAAWERLNLIASTLLNPAPSQHPNRDQLARDLVHLLYELGVIKNFDRMSWTEPHPVLEQIHTLNATTTKRHIIRTVRMERFSWGELDANIKNKILPSLCIHLCKLQNLIGPHS
jgi:hypothetical protein